MMLLLVEVYARPGQAANHRTPKGLAVSVRPWDHQLRQAIQLASPYSVVARAPVEGFLHRTSELDTLGDDELEASCRLTGSRHADRSRRPGPAGRHHPGNRQVRAAAKRTLVRRPIDAIDPIRTFGAALCCGARHQ